MVDYFGYGITRDIMFMRTLLGRRYLVGLAAVLVDHELCIQHLLQVPDAVFHGAPRAVSPRSILRGAYGFDFRHYIIRATSGGRVQGVVWRIAHTDLALMDEWELVGFGLEERVEATAVDSNGLSRLVFTHRAREQSIEYETVVHSADYNDYLLNKERVIAVAKAVRRQFCLHG